MYVTRLQCGIRHVLKTPGNERLVDFVHNMATFAVVFSLFVIAVVSLLSLIIATISLYFAYLHWKYSHLPGPKRDGFFSGNIPHILRERERGKIVHEVMDDLHRIYGPVVLMWAYHRPFTFVSDPELVRKCLINLNLPKNRVVYDHLAYPFGQRMAGRGVLNEVDHEVWQRRRALLNPAFHRRYLMNLMPAFNSSCDLFLAKLEKMADGKTVVDMAQEFARVTLDVIGKVLVTFKDDFQSVLHSLSTLMFIHISSHSMECESIFVMNLMS